MPIGIRKPRVRAKSGEVFHSHTGSDPFKLKLLERKAEGGDRLVELQEKGGSNIYIVRVSGSQNKPMLMVSAHGPGGRVIPFEFRERVGPALLRMLEGEHEFDVKQSVVSQGGTSVRERGGGTLAIIYGKRKA